MVSVIDQYSEASGSKVNRDKSFALPDIFPRPQQKVKVLGIEFGPDDYTKFNWEARLNDADVKVKSWKGWQLSLRERVDLIKTNLIPTFLYVCFV